MTHHEERAPDDALRNHPLRDTQEFESDIRAREASVDGPRVGAAGAVGGAGGALAGAGIGTIVGGPIGAIIGAIAGAVGGWWAGQAAADPATTITPADEARYRALYEGSPYRLADRTYDDVRAFYHLGHVASINPDYARRPFEDIEDDLQKGWTPELRSRYGDWSYARQFARESFTKRTKRED
jgi:hypothetical protein